MGKPTARTRAFALARKASAEAKKDQPTKKKMVDIFPNVTFRRSIWSDVADLLQGDQMGNIEAAVVMLFKLAELLPATGFMADATLLRRIQHIAETETLTAERLAYIFDRRNEYYTSDGYFLVSCWTCQRITCLVPGPGTDYVYNVRKGSNTRGKKHECRSSASTTTSRANQQQAEVMGQHYTDSDDGSHGLGQVRRDFNGQFGSMPSYDKHDEDAQ